MQAAFGFALAFFKALAAIPKILELVKGFAAGAAAWYAENATSETIKELADGFALLGKAQAGPEGKAARIEAIKKINEALRRPRVTP